MSFRQHLEDRIRSVAGSDVRDIFTQEIREVLRREVRTMLIAEVQDRLDTDEIADEVTAVLQARLVRDYVLPDIELQRRHLEMEMILDATSEHQDEVWEQTEKQIEPLAAQIRNHAEEHLEQTIRELRLRAEAMIELEIERLNVSLNKRVEEASRAAATQIDYLKAQNAETIRPLIESVLRDILAE